LDIFSILYIKDTLLYICKSEHSGFFTQSYVYGTAKQQILEL